MRYQSFTFKRKSAVPNSPAACGADAPGAGGWPWPGSPQVNSALTVFTAEQTFGHFCRHTHTAWG